MTKIGDSKTQIYELMMETIVFLKVLGYGFRYGLGFGLGVRVWAKVWVRVIFAVVTSDVVKVCQIKILLHKVRREDGKFKQNYTLHFTFRNGKLIKKQLH